MTTLHWYWNRLRSMSPAELFYRMEQLIIRLIDHLRYWSGYSRRSWLTLARDIEREGPASFSLWFFGLTGDRQQLRDSLWRQFPGHVSNCVHEAKLILAGNVQILGQQFEIGKHIDWHRHPITRRSYPRKFAAKVNTRSAGEVGGILWHRELNRHYHFPALAEAFFLTQDLTFAETLKAQWISWLDQNPPLEGVNWRDSLDISVRIINWCWAYHLSAPYLEQDPESRTHILASLVEQVKHVVRHPSKYSSANNHLIGEMAGIAVAAFAFPGLIEQKYLKESLEILNREVGRQIYPDGVPAEQSLGYLFFDFDLLIIVWRLVQEHGLEVPKIWMDRLSAAAEFVSDVSTDEGKFPAIGDDDEAVALKFAGADPSSRAESFLVAAGILLGRDDFRRDNFNWNVHNQWLFGDNGSRQFYGTKPSSGDNSSRLFPHGGYACLKTENVKLVMDIGPLGYLSTAAHGHADALALLLWLGDTPMIVDSGTFAYQEGGKWRDYFRGTSAHNTLRVDGRDQSEMQGNFLWGHKAEVTLLHHEIRPESSFLVAEHNGYSDIGVRHRRAVLLEAPGNLLIADMVLGTGHRLIEQFWHFPAQANVELNGKMASGVVEGLSISCTWSWENEKAQVSIADGRENPIQGWVSPHYGEKLPAPVLVCHGEAGLPLRCFTLFQLGQRTVEGELLMQEMQVRLNQRFEGMGS